MNQTISQKNCCESGKTFQPPRHQRRAEHWFVVSGEGRVTLDEELIALKPGKPLTFRLEPCTAWKIREEELSFIEVQTGDYLKEDDIERFEDDFGGPAEFPDQSMRQYPGFHGIVPHNPNRAIDETVLDFKSMYFTSRGTFPSIFLLSRVQISNEAGL